MVDRRGSILNSREAFSTIWENRGEYDETNSAVFRKTLMRLRENLERAGIGELLIGEIHRKTLNSELFECDLYAFLDGDENTIKRFSGEYMSQYSWAESTLANLLNIKKRYL
jgi:two-component SAPR family response regulator